jgi:hypothetical protein
MPPLAFLLVGIAIGAGSVLFVPSVAPQITRNLRPAAKAVVKTALELGHALRVRAAELSEQIDDFVAEARADTTADNGAAAETASNAASSEAETMQTAKQPRAARRAKRRGKKS